VNKMTTWTPNKYNRYKVTLIDGATQIVFAPTAEAARKDVETAIPIAKIKNIELWE